MSVSNSLMSARVAAKLLTLVLGLSAITVIVGVAGYWALSQTQTSLNHVAQEHLPAVRSLLVMKENANSIKAATRTLLDLNLDPATRQRQYQTIAASTTAYQEAWQVFQSLPHDAKDEETWTEFQPLAHQWQADTEKFVQMMRQVDALNLGEGPRVLLRNLEIFHGDHYKWEANVASLVYGGESFEGGEDYQTCNLGNWLKTFTTQHAGLQRLKQEIDGPHRDMHKGLTQAKAFVRDGKTDKAVELFKTTIRPAAQTTRGMIDQMRDIAQSTVEQSAACERQALDVCRVTQQKADTQLTKLITLRSQQADVAAEESQSLAASARWLLIGTVLAGVLCGLGMGSLVSGSITRPLAVVVTHLGEVARGNLGLHLAPELLTRQDEIGTLSRELDATIASLRNVVGQIHGNSRELAHASSELAATSTQLANGAEETTSQSAQVASAAEQMSATMANMASATAEMSTGMKTVASAVEEMTASITEVARSAEQTADVAQTAAQIVEGSNTQMSQLGNAADEIGKVIEVIQDIAEQTNLLALNATIEAARAGDAGKGFAVVATEVKELARQTSTATEDIRNRIEGIQKSSGIAVQSIADIREVIGKVSDLSRTIASAVEEQSITTKEIARNVAQSSMAAHTVASGVAQSASASQEIARTIAGVDQASRQSAEGAVQTQSAGRNMSQMADQLQSLVGKFSL